MFLFVNFFNQVYKIFFKKSKKLIDFIKIKSELKK